MSTRYLLLAVLATAFCAGAARHEPYDRSRVFWDQASICTPLPGTSYGRVIELPDGRLFIVGHNSKGVESAFSSDGGRTWTTPERIIAPEAGWKWVNPDPVQISDGTILLGLNHWPDRHDPQNSPYSIDVIRSTDNGETWSEPTRIFTVSHVGTGGNWEPFFLELPSGEIHCYFSLEFYNSGDQEIMMARSFDKGFTWTEAKRVSYREHHRDGMPVALITDNGEIVVSIEDNGQPGYGGFRATTFRCKLEENWANDMWINGGSPNRSLMLVNAADLKYISAGPYMRKLPDGEIIASWMGEKESTKDMGLERYNHFVAVGDADARNFKGANTSFYIPEGGRGTWGSVTPDSQGNIYGVAEIAGDGLTSGVGIIKGKLRRGFEAAWGTPVLDASFKKDPYTSENGRQLTLGSQTGNRLEMDFLYDNENLYFYLFAQDKEILLDEPIDKDGIFLSLDVAGCCDSYPQEGMFKFFFGANGEITLRRGNANKWQTEEPAPESVRMEKKVGRTYYMMECAIPWSVLGEQGAPESSRVMRINVQQRDRRARKLLNEKIPDAADRSSWTWPEFRLLEDAGVEAPAADRQKLRFGIEGRTVSVKGIADADIQPIIEIYTTSGLKVVAGRGTLTVPEAGIYVMRATFASGKSLQSLEAVK